MTNNFITDRTLEERLGMAQNAAVYCRLIPRVYSNHDRCDLSKSNEVNFVTFVFDFGTGRAAAACFTRLEDIINGRAGLL